MTIISFKLIYTVKDGKNKIEEISVDNLKNPKKEIRMFLADFFLSNPEAISKDCYIVKTKSISEIIYQESKVNANK